MSSKSSYSRFEKINGEHPLKETVPAIHVGFDAYQRLGGVVLYFNFELAKEMGLIAKNHSHQLNSVLENVLLDC